MKARAAAALLSFALVPLPAQSGVNRWTPVANLPESSAEPATLWSTPTAPGLLWAQSGGGWIWQSSDGGSHFALTKGQLGFYPGLTFDPSDPARAWAFGEGGVFETRDAGRSWQRRIVGAPYDMVWTPIRGGVLIGSDPSANRLLVSYRGRAAWRTLGDCIGGILRVAPSDGSVFCFGRNALYRVDRNGRMDFVPVVLDGNPNWMLADLIVAPRDPSVLYAVLSTTRTRLARSDDRGLTWQALPDPVPPIPETNQPIYRLLAAGPDSQRLRALVDLVDPGSGARSTAVVESLDGGLTWSTPRPAPSTAVFADPAHPQVLFAWQGFTLARSPDDGRTWQLTGGLPFRGSLESPVAHLVARAQTEILGLVAAGGDSIQVARTLDGGRSWQRNLVPPSLWPQYGKLVADPADPSRLYLVTQRGVAGSDDDGESWSLLSPPSLYTTRDLVVSPRDGVDLYAITDQSLVGVSHDRGETWTVTGSGLGPVEDPDHGGGSGGLALVLDAGAPQRAWLAFDAALPGGWDIYHTADSGLTWHPSRSGIPHLADRPRGLLRTSTGRLLVGTTSGLLASRDGLDWRLIGIAPIELLLANPDTATLYATIGPEGSAQLSVSSDDGETWEPITCGLPGGIPEKLLLDPSASGRLLATLRDLGLWSARFDRPCP